MKNASRDILLAAIIGDALGSAVEGMGRGHINVHFKEITGYMDPEPALKNRMERWRKPGLDSSISQFMLILAMTSSRKGPCAEAFTRHVTSSPELPDYRYGIFRYPDSVEKKFIDTLRDARRGTETSTLPRVRIIPALTPLSFRGNSPLEQVADVAGFVRRFTHDLPTMAAGLLYSFLLTALLNERSVAPAPLRKALEVAESLAATVETNSSSIFSMALNPDALKLELLNLSGALRRIIPPGTKETAEDIICSWINRSLKTPITRATVNIPPALLLHSLSLCTHLIDDSRLMFRAAAEGGAAASLTAMTGVIAACILGPAIVPETLVRNLVNRKKIISHVDTLAGDAVPSERIVDFIRSEASLPAT